MADSREEFGGRTHHGDELGNPVNQPTTVATYGHPSRTDDTPQAYGTPETPTGGGQQQQRRRPVAAEADYDPTQRRGTTTGEYGRSGIGLMDRAKEKLDEVGGFKEDPGHTTAAAAATNVGGGEEDGGGQIGLREKIKEKVT